MSSKSSRSDDSDDDFGDGEGSTTNSSSAFSLLNSGSVYTTNSFTTTSSTYSLNDKRRSRNQNEKKRRDQFNSLIIELSSLLNYARKIDKATVLAETLHFIRNYKGPFCLITPLYITFLYSSHHYFQKSLSIIKRSISNTNRSFCKTMTLCDL